jgi:hypothetical protein
MIGQFSHYMLVRNLTTGTSPCVLHRNGNPPEWSARWKQIVSDFFQETPDVAASVDEVTVLTWNSRPTKTLLERCLDRSGVSYVTLGKHLTRWRTDMKVYLNAHALADVRTPYVMALDADDVLLVSSVDRLLAEFLSFECDIVFSGEKNSYPEVLQLMEFEQSIAESPYCYLNSGAWIGRTETCRRFFRDCLEEHHGDLVAAHPVSHVLRDDQGLTRKTFRRYHPATRIDYHCRLFQSLYDVALEGEVLIAAEECASRT